MTLRFAEYLDRSFLKNFSDTHHGNHLILYPTVYDFKLPYKQKPNDLPPILDISFEMKESLIKEWISTGGNIQDSLKLQNIPPSKLTPEEKKCKELGDILSTGALALPMLKIEQ